MNLPMLLLLSLGHLLVDMEQGALPFLLPFFKDTYNLSYTMVGIVVLVNNLSSSIIQPLFGYWSDRKAMNWLLPAGCLLSGLGLGIAGITPSFKLMLPFILLAGLGVASYHPEASKVARWVSGPYKTTSMAIYSVGGNVGIGLGPVLAAVLYARYGLKGSVGLIVPALVMFAVFCLMLPRIRSITREPVSQGIHEVKPRSDALPEVVPGVQGPEGKGKGKTTPAASSTPYGILPVVLLVLVVVMRSWAHAGLTNYIPIYHINYLGTDPTRAGSFLTVFLLSGAIGTLVGSPIADRWGLRNLIIATMVVQVPLIYLFPLAHGFWAYAVVAASGLSIVATFATTVVLGHELLPRHVGLASGLMLGFAIGTGGLGVTLMGSIADHWGVLTALRLLCFPPAIAVVLSWFLPKLANTRQRSA